MSVYVLGGIGEEGLLPMLHYAPGVSAAGVAARRATDLVMGAAFGVMISMRMGFGAWFCGSC